MRSRSRSGFTLIELLVVIAIIAILAAILFPVFAKAKERARQTTCQSNTTQISRAWMMYSEDYDEFCPPLTLDWYISWAEELFPYVKTVEVFGCPSSWVPKNMEEITGRLTEGKMSYGWNATVFNYTRALGGLAVRMSDIEEPSGTVFLCDSNGANWISLPGGTHWRSPVNDPKYGKGYNCRPPENRHNGIVNCAFADGHSKGIKYDELIKDVPNTNGRKVARFKQSGSTVGGYEWTTDTSINIFPYFAVSAQRNMHF